MNVTSTTFKGEPVLLAGVLNITERRAAEQALKESEERYALAMEGSHEGLWDWDLRSNEVYISPRIATLLELPGGDLRIRPDQWEAAMHPNDIDAHTEAVKAHLRGETEFSRPSTGRGSRTAAIAGCITAASACATKTAGSIAWPAHSATSPSAGSPSRCWPKRRRSSGSPWTTCRAACG